MANNQYPTFNSQISTQPKEYPNLSQIVVSEAEDTTYNVQGSKIQNNPIQKGMESIRDSDNPMYDVNYDSGNAKSYVPPIQNPPNQQNNIPNNIPNNAPNNVPNYNLTNSSVRESALDEQYDSEKAKVYQPIPQGGLNDPNLTYNQKSYDKSLDTKYDSSPAGLAMNQNNQPIPPPYGFAPPSGPGMFPHFPHHPHFPHYPHYPPPYPYEPDYYAYC